MRANAFAWAALAIWPVVVLAVYAGRARTAPIARTTAWMMILPVMFLPANLVYEAPGIPALDKHRISFIAIAMSLELFHRRSWRETFRSHTFARLVLIALWIGVYQTVRTNPDPLWFGPTRLPGLATHDALSIAATLFLDVYLPFAVGERVFRTERDIRELLDVLALCALFYVPLCLVELRFSPQLHRWVYGYHQHEFMQHVRAGGFRPKVFMNHGLSVAMFMATAFVAALTLRRARISVWPSTRIRIAVLGTMVVACKSLAAILYALAAAVLERLAARKVLGRIMLATLAIVIAYPIVRASKDFPRNDVIAAFERLSVERAESLRFRFMQEEQLLARARERPVFGWGTWGRNQIFASWGQKISIADGYWIILLGTFGYVGFACFFLLVMAPVMRYVLARARMGRSAQVLAGGLALLLLFRIIDLIPNARSDNLSVAFAGALFAVCDRRLIERVRAATNLRTTRSARPAAASPPAAAMGGGPGKP